MQSPRELDAFLLKSVRLSDKHTIASPEGTVVLWNGDLLRMYWEHHPKPHTGGVALMSSSHHDRAFHRGALIRLHPDNACVSENHFFIELGKAWACANREKLEPGIPLKHLVVLKRDYDDKTVLTTCGAPELIRQLTSETNCIDYGVRDEDGYGIASTVHCEKFYRPWAGEDNGEAEKVRREILRHLAEDKGVAGALLNERLSPAQTQFCLRLYLDGGADAIKLIKGYEIDEELLALLHLEKKEKPPVSGRRMMDLVGLYDRFGSEIELLECSLKGHVQFYVGFDKGGEGADQVRAYSEGTPLDFLEDCPRIGLKELFAGK